MQKIIRLKIGISILFIVSINSKSHGQYLTESFSDITTLAASGWVVKNNSNPLGSTTWFQGASATTFPPFSAPGYIAANFNNTTGNNTISNWLLTPTLLLQNGMVFNFRTRTATVQSFPDRLQVRLSTNGTSTNVGVTNTSVGDFSTLLLDINPLYDFSSYPNTWTQYTIVISGLPIAIQGKIAFRYFVEAGGPAGDNSNYIGIDDVFSTVPGCEIPTSNSVNALTSTTATFSWVELGNYIMEYGLTGFVPGTGATAGIGGTVVAATASPLVLSALTPSTNYTAFFRKNCVAGFSPNGTAINFTTKAINDECNGATNLTPIAGLFTSPGGQSFDNTTLSNIPVSCGIAPGGGTTDLWYKVTTDNDGIPNETLFLRALPKSGLDVAIAAYTGTCGMLTQVACVNNNPMSITETLTLNNVGDNVTYYIRINNVNSSDQDFSINMTGSTVLPLSIFNFSAKLFDKNAVLKWQTGNDINTQYYAVERSTDGRVFTEVGTVMANHSSTNNYMYKDNIISITNAPTMYYRIHQHDINGTSNYSNILALKINRTNNSIQIYPNPVNDKLNILFSSLIKQSIQVIITDIKGTKAIESNRVILAGNNELAVNISKLVKGTYILIVRGQQIKEKQFFIKN